MKNALVVLLALMPISVMALPPLPPPPPALPYVFELTDGYFQDGYGRPVHLIHPYDRQLVNLGDSIHTWYTVSLKKGYESPCAERDEKPCTFFFQFVSDDEKKTSWGTQRNPHETRTSVTGEFWLGFGFEINRELTIKGPGTIVIVIKKEDQMIFSHSIPVYVD